jgi:hypothetical protein
MITQPIQDAEVFQTVVTRGLSIFGITHLPRTQSEATYCLERVPAILKVAPKPTGAVDAPLRQGQHLSAVGVVYGSILQLVFGWTLCEIREDDSRPEDGIVAIVSPDQSYFIFPIDLVYKEERRHGDECRRVYEKIKTKNLPDVPPGSFFEISV